MSDDPTRTFAASPSESDRIPDPRTMSAANSEQPPAVVPDDVTAPWAQDDDRGEETETGEPAAASLGGIRLPGYAIVGELGRGGMAIVYRARHLALNRTIAVKSILRTDPAGRARFLAEAEAVAAVKHPHVIQVFDFGETGGVPFLAMEYLPGGTLAARLRTGPPLASADAAALVQKLAAGVAAAHDLGIVHRDLKPANVLFDEQDQPKVADFGLAKRTTGSDLTATQVVMGTPAYMAPEQARGAKYAGPPADVWALGVILYECLTGSRPFGGDGFESILTRVLNDEPARPRVLNAAIPRDLELIVRKCLEKDPADRYPTASELADDLGRFVRGEPIGVRPAGPIERAAKWARRKPTLAAAYGLLMAALLLGVVTVGAVWLWRKADAERAIAVAARRDAESTRDQLTAAQERLRRVEYSRTIQLANRELVNWDLGRALPLLAGTREDLRGWEWRYLHRLSHYELLTLKAGPTAEEAAEQMQKNLAVAQAKADEMRKALKLPATGATPPLNVQAPDAAVRFSPDGARIITIGTDRVVRVWHATTGSLIHTITDPANPLRLTLEDQQEQVAFLTFSADGTRALARTKSGFGRGPVSVLDAATGAELYVIGGGTVILETTAFSPDGTRILTREMNAKSQTLFGPITTPVIESIVRLRETATGKEILTIRHEASIGDPAAYGSTFPAFSPDGSRILADGASARVQVWDARSGKLVSTLAGDTKTIRNLRFSPEGQWIVSGNSIGTDRVWNATTGEVAATFQDSSIAAFNPNGSGLLTVQADKQLTLRTIDLRTGKDAWRNRLGAAVNDIKISPDGARMLAWVTDARLLDARTGKEIARLPVLPTNARVIFNPDGSRLLTIGADNSARLWDTRNGTEVRLVALSVRATGAAFSRDGTQLVTWGDGHTAHVWDAITGRSILPLLGHTAPVTSAAFGPDGRRVATASADGTAKVWNTRDERLPVSLPVQGAVYSAAFSPDGLRVVTAADRVARLWDARTRAEITMIPASDSAISVVAFSSNGDRIYAGSLNGTVHVWDVSTRTEVRAFTGHTGQLTAIALNAARGRVVTTSFDRTARVWDAKTGQQLHVLRHTQSVTSAGFSPDGSRVVTACDDKIVRVWDADTGTEVRSLTQAEPVGIVAFSPKNGHHLLIGGRGERVVRVWDVQADREVLALQHPAGVTAAAFSADGERIVTGSSDGMLRVWDANTGDEMLPIPCSAAGVASVAFSPDGSRLLAIRTGPFGQSPPVRWVKLFGTRVPVRREESAVLIWDSTPLSQSAPLR